MRLLPLTAILAALASLAGAGAVMAHLVPLSDYWDLRHSTHDLAVSTAATERLDRALDIACRRSAEKQRVTGDVIAGRLTLAEAAERFARLDAEWLDRAGPLNIIYTPPVGREPVWGSVIAWVKIALADAPDQGASVVSRLEAEYRDYFGHASPSP